MNSSTTSLQQQWKMWHVVLIILLSLILGMILGALIYAYAKASAYPALSTTQDARNGVGTVTLERIQNNALVGTMEGDVRLVIGEQAIVPDEEGAFVFQDSAFLINHIEVIVPEGMLFVASSRGKKYYSVDSAGGQRIVPENRVYFRSATEAEAAGYER